MEEQGFDQACRFLYALAAAVQRYGVSSSSMESMLSRAAHALQVQGQFIATPTQVQSIIWDEREGRQRLHLSVSNTGDYDLTRLARITELVDSVVSGDTGPEAGLERLRAIESAVPEYGPGTMALAFVLCGLGYGVMLGLSWLDVLLGGALGVVSFGITRLAARSPRLATALELAVAGVAAALSTLLARVVPGSNALGVAVCAVIFFVPGFGLTLGANELMRGYTLSGLIGFTRAITGSVKLVIGAMIGNAVVRGLMDVPAATAASGVPHAWTWVFAPVLVLGLAILFRVRRRDLLWPVLAGIVVWIGVEAGSGLGLWQGTFIGAFLLMTASRLFARRSGLPEAIILLPAVMLLVPGVAALAALYAAQTAGLVKGLQLMFNVMVLIAAILGGLMLGDAVWSVREVALSAITSGRSRRGA